MGNQILDWQYEYYWQHKHPDYFGRPRWDYINGSEGN